MKKEFIENVQLNPQITKNLLKNKFTTATTIQQKTIKPILEGKDTIAVAKTGSGKTLCFLIPTLSNVLDDLRPEDTLRVLILTPTRELCLQVFDVACSLARNSPLKIAKIFGGLKQKQEEKNVEEANVLVATPGRLIEYLSRLENFNTDLLDCLVVDEFDKMIEMGFREELAKILEYLPETQKNLFSATSKNYDVIQKIIPQKDPKFITDFSKTTVEHLYRELEITEKINNLYSILKYSHKSENSKSIVFFSTCKAAKFHFLLFSKFFKDCYLLCSSSSQKQRLDNFSKFQKNPGILFCTDLAARGLDFEDINNVIQFDCPDSVQTYIHRSGRTGRKEKEGKSYVFLLKEEKRLLEFLKNETNKNFEFAQTEIKIEEMESFEVRKLDRKLKGLFRSSKDLREFVVKYVRTYENYLKMNKKKFPVNFKEEIEKLAEYLGIK